MNDIVTTGSSPRRIRLTNLVAALQNLSDSGRMSRAELARRLNLNRSSSGQIVSELTQCGLVREVENAELPQEAVIRSAGRPGIMLELVAEAAFFVGIEIGVEHISAVTIDLTGAARTHNKVAFDTPSATVKEAITRAFDLAFGAMSAEMIERCQGVGISAPMHIRPDGVVSLAPLIGWRDIHFVQTAQAALPVAAPIMIENDANAFAIGDSYKHSQSGVTLFLLIETGVGGGILIDGKLFRGGHGLSGEIGHMLVPGSGGVSLEQLIGRDVLTKRYRAGTSNPEADLQDFLSAVRDREPIAVSIAEDWSRHLGAALYQACRLIDPERIVLGGSVAALYPMTAARVALHMNVKQAVTFPIPQIAVDEDAEFGSAFGAACLLHQRFMSLENEVLGSETVNFQRPAHQAGQTVRTVESVN
ncbi:MAG: ROK family transcriptional regulator [Rhizobiaceae bacterium]